MEELQRMAVASPVTDQAPEAPMLKEQVVEEVLAQLRRGESVLALARAYDVDPKTIRAWRRRGSYRPRDNLLRAESGHRKYQSRCDDRE